MSLGYENAPITLVLTLLTIILTLIYGTSEIISFDIQRLYNYEVWRLFTSQCIFSNMAQTFIGMLLLYICRQFERQFGSRKYGGFVVLSYLVSVLVQFLVLMIVNSIGVDFTPAHGPFFLIFSLLPLFYAYVPRLQSTEFSILGLGFSEKSWTYLLGLQLSLSQGFRSLLPSLIGMLFGYLYIKNLLLMQKFRLPKFLETFFRIIGKFVLGFFSFANPQQPTTTGTDATNRRNAAYQPLNNRPPRIPSSDYDGGGYGDWGDLSGDDYGSVGGGSSGRLYGGAPRAPTEQEIESVTALGFDRDAATQALRNTNNNVEAAANLLLR